MPLSDKNDKNKKDKNKKGRNKEAAAKTSPVSIACGKALCVSLPAGRAEALVLRTVLPGAQGQEKAAKSINGFYSEFYKRLRAFCERELLPRALSEQALCQTQRRPFRRVVCDVTCALTGGERVAGAKIFLKVIYRGKTVFRRTFIHCWDLKKGRLLPEKVCSDRLNNSDFRINT